MRFSSNRAEFLGKLEVVARAAAATASGATLGGVLIEAAVADTQAQAEAGIRLSCTDLQLSLRTWIAQSVDEPGAVVLPARPLLQALKSLQAKEVSFAYDAAKGQVTITAGTSSFELRILPREEFPKLPVLDQPPVRIPAQSLAKTIAQVARAASKDETRPMLTGVLFKAAGGQLTMVATDSYRLAVRTSQLEEEVPYKLEALIPARALCELARLTKKGGAEAVEITLAQQQVIFTVGGVALSSRLLQGQFPAYERLFPERHQHELLMDRHQLLAAVERISLMAGPANPIACCFEQGKLTVWAETPELGKATDELPCPYQADEPLLVGFNPAYLKDGLEAFDDDQLLLKLNAPQQPVLLTPSSGSDLLYLLMPMRINP